ncbi:MAG: NAD-dependent deacetylase [Asgard group archaeon]
MPSFGRRTKKAAELIIKAENVTAFIGAKLSEESGIPDFHDPTIDLWRKYNPLKHMNYDVFLKDPLPFWKVGQKFHAIMYNAKTNKGHEALAELQRLGKLHGAIMTNIDALLQKAGFKDVVEINGGYYHTKCMNCQTPWYYDVVAPKLDSGEVPPLCNNCGGVLRPGVVLFGEQIPMKAYQNMMKMIRATDCLLVVGSKLGTNLERYTVKLVTEENRKSCVYINSSKLESAKLNSYFDAVLIGDVVEILQKLVSETKKQIEKQ